MDHYLRLILYCTVLKIFNSILVNISIFNDNNLENREFIETKKVKKKLDFLF